jgi:uncharacterized membrane protein YeaQ/YmgE (transglycosylase-associated protein family)
MNIIVWLIIGALAGWLAGKLIKGGGFGLLWNIIIGIIGSFIGGFVFGLLGIQSLGVIGSFIAAVVGAVILLLIVRLIKR